ncbi:hypothetical protein DY000_02009286 [Brassica cretica]|uniref:Uncharacterized protein n=1 Tax=Brassica cretica TaxID=69181 RepID=A0ABQ7BUC3_BRACR|nr:hypothetical protein DY000_02009286 [Brassica cretica]
MRPHLSRSCSLPLEDRHISISPQKRRPPQVRQTSHTAATQATFNPSRDSTFKSRLDRHGRPFGERLPTQPARGRPLANKIFPSVASQPNPPTSPSRAYNRREPSPQHRRNRQHMGSPTYRQDTRGTSQQWREKLTHNPRTTQEENLPNPTDNIQGAHSEPHSNNKRPPLERNLAVATFPIQHIPRYLQLKRQQRILQSEMEGLMEMTAVGIIEAATQALRGMESSPTMPLDFHNVAVPSPQVAQ